MKKLIFNSLFFALIVFSSAIKSQAQFNFTVNPQAQCYSVNGNTANLIVTQAPPGASSYSWSIQSPVFNCNPVLTSFTCCGAGYLMTFSCCGVYTITGTAFTPSNVPIASLTKTAAVHCPPNITVGGGNMFCLGSQVQFLASGATSYTWSNGFTGNPLVTTPSVSTCYTVVGSNANGCTGTAVKCFSLTSQQPTVNIVGPDTVCSGSNFVLIGTGANSYTWSTGATTSSISVNISSLTCLVVSGSNGGGCSDSAMKCIQVLPGVNPVISGNALICSGGSTTLTASGATTYTWIPGNSNAASIVVSPTATTCYTLIGKNGFNCAGTAVKCVTVATTPSISLSNGQFCAGSLGTLVASGASNYTWLPFGLTGSMIALTPSVSMCYTVIGSNGPGCQSSALGCFSVAPVPTITIAGPGTLCAGNSTSLIASGGTSYFWSTGSTSSHIGIFPAVTTCYTVTGSNSACSASAVKCVTVIPSGFSVTGNNNICPGGTATLTASGSANYTWIPGGLSGSVVVVSPSVTTCYTVMATNASGCQNAQVHCVSVNPNPNISTFSGPVCAGNPVTLTATGASTYTWHPFNMTGQSIVLTPSANTCYTVVGTSSAGCVGSAMNCFSITPNPTITVAGNGTLCAGASVTLTAAGAQSYTWSNGSTGAGIVVSPTANTCYTVSGNSLGCGASAVKCVTVLPNSFTISGNNNLCGGGSTTLTASGASNYTWLPGGLSGSVVVVSPTVTTCYTVTGSNINGCQKVNTYCVFVNPIPVVSVNHGQACVGSPLLLTATGAASYTWIPFNLTGPSVVITPSANACYTVIATSSAGCMGSANGCFSVTPSPTITIAGNSTLCSGTSVTLTASGASTYTWSNGSNSQNIVVSPTASACYTVSGSQQGCNNSAVKCLTVTPSANVAISGNSMVCQNNSLALSGSGASSFTWLPGGQHTPSISVNFSTATCYTLLGSNGTCTGSAVKCVTAAPAPTISISGLGGVCAGDSAVVILSGAQSYTWYGVNQTGSVAIFVPSSSICFSVAGTNAFGCTAFSGGCVSVTPGPSISITGTTSICVGNSAVLSTSGASSFTWLPGNSSSPSITVNPQSSACYTVVGVNNAGCTSSAIKCVTIRPLPVISVGGNTNVCSGMGTTLTLAGAATYTWFPGGSTGSVVAITPTANTCFSIAGTSSHGCVGHTGVCLNLVNQPTMSIVGAGTVCAGAAAVLHAQGAPSVTWMPGNITSPSISVSPFVTTCYTVTGSTAPGCVNSAAKCLTVTPGPTVQIVGDSVICRGGNAILHAIGANTYTWNTGANSPSIFVTPSVTTNYSVTGMTSAGCKNSSTVTVHVIICSALADLDAGTGVRIWPNPAKESVTINSVNDSQSSYVMHDLTGRLLSAGVFTKTVTISVSEFPAGTYIISIRSGDENPVHRKVILE